MNFKSFAKLFGEKEQHILATPQPDRTALMRIAMRIHDAGFDWYLADDDVCFGGRPPEHTQAIARAGRIWDKHTITINSVQKRRAALPPMLSAKMRRLAQRREEGGRRLRFSIQSFDELVGDKAFLEQLAMLSGVSGREAHWPIDLERKPKREAIKSVQEVFKGNKRATRPRHTPQGI